MSSQPEVFLCRNKRRLDLKIRGDIGWNLTNELIYFLRKRLDTVPKVYIHNPREKHNQILGLDIFLPH